ncbi:MBL fold metallo-hydrolase [Streptomyces spinoverrucosus]|uniref:MBL fold metallo-hydrolase n=1 Tax=Streptomyces spinoverrucosus TaxID=284043 RepID=UPI00142F0253
MAAVLVTHAHNDHIGAAEHLRATYDVPVPHAPGGGTACPPRFPRPGVRRPGARAGMAARCAPVGRPRPPSRWDHACPGLRAAGVPRAGSTGPARCAGARAHIADQGTAAAARHVPHRPCPGSRFPGRDRGPGRGSHPAGTRPGEVMSSNPREVEEGPHFP